MLVLCNIAKISASRARKSSNVYKRNPFQIELKSNLDYNNRQEIHTFKGVITSFRH